MASLELECRIVNKLAPTSGRSPRGEWSKQEIIVEYKDGNFPTKVCMSVWGVDKVRDLEKFQIGEQVKVSFSLSSREFSGKWYNDIRIWRMEHVSDQAQRPSAYSAPAVQPPIPTVEDMPGADFGSEDLPF